MRISIDVPTPTWEPNEHTMREFVRRLTLLADIEARNPGCLVVNFDPHEGACPTCGSKPAE